MYWFQSFFIILKKTGGSTNGDKGKEGGGKGCWMSTKGKFEAHEHFIDSENGNILRSSLFLPSEIFFFFFFFVLSPLYAVSQIRPRTVIFTLSVERERLLSSK